MAGDGREAYFVRCLSALSGVGGSIVFVDPEPLACFLDDPTCGVLWARVRDDGSVALSTSMVEDADDVAAYACDVPRDGPQPPRAARVCGVQRVPLVRSCCHQVAFVKRAPAAVASGCTGATVCARAAGVPPGASGSAPRRAPPNPRAPGFHSVHVDQRQRSRRP